MSPNNVAEGSTKITITFPSPAFKKHSTQKYDGCSYPYPDSWKPLTYLVELSFVREAVLFVTVLVKAYIFLPRHVGDPLCTLVVGENRVGVAPLSEFETEERLKIESGRDEVRTCGGWREGWMLRRAAVRITVYGTAVRRRV